MTTKNRVVCHLSKRTCVTGMILSVVVFIGMLLMPKSAGIFPAIFGLLSLVCFPVFLIALIVGNIRAKKKPATVSSTSTIVTQPTPPPAPIPTPAPKKAATIERVHVRGVDNYVANIRSVAMENPDYNLSKRELQEDYLDERVWQYQFFGKAALVPEPDNEYDPNAIMVQADGLGIGYIPKGSTAHIRKLMESGRIKYLDLKIGGGKYKEVTEVDDDEYELKRGEHPYSAVLEIHLTEE